jgi:hypothetical protein
MDEPVRFKENEEFFWLLILTIDSRSNSLPAFSFTRRLWREKSTGRPWPAARGGLKLGLWGTKNDEVSSYMI